MCNQLSHIYQEPLFKEMEEPKLYSCDCGCGEDFEQGIEVVNPDTRERWRFKKEHSDFIFHLEALKEFSGLSDSKILAITTHNVKTL